ncbi:MAG: GAF domain-containing protein, partial [Planctomycetaceae bacterium]
AVDYLKEIRVKIEGELGRGPTGTCILEDHPVINDDFGINPLTAPWREAALRFGFRGSAAFPLRQQGRPIGVLSLYAADPCSFDQEQVTLLQALCADISYALEAMQHERLRTEAERSLRKSETRSKLLSETAGRCLITDNPQEIVKELCRDVMTYLDCHAFFNILAEESSGRLHLNAWAGIPEEEARKIEWLDYGVAACGCVARDGCRIAAEHIPTTPDVRTELVKSYGIKAYACHPLLGLGGKVIGTISFGTRSRETFSEDDLSLMKAVADQAAVAMERVRLIEELQRSRDNLEMMVQDRTADLAQANKELQAEIAKREKAEHQLLQAQKLESIGTLTGGIAHDFNNILGAVVINSELALMDLPAGAGVRSNLELIRKAGERGRDLVKQMLLFSRKSEKKQEILTLTPLIKETFKLLRSSIPTSIQMELHLGTESDTVYADRSQVQQVIMNLCTNAAYSMGGKKGSIDISLQGITFGSVDLPSPDMEPGEYLVLSVKDTGSGMDEEVKKRIFEPFFTTKPVGEGTGLGLSVVYGIVKSHKGNITVFSEPGKGSVFKVYLPKAITGFAEETEAPQPIPRGNERILFVDDEEIIVQSVRNMLERLGYKVTTVTDSEDALKLFSAKPSEFDLVMTDQTMPGMTGEDLGKEVMRLRPGIPVILCTGYSDLVSSEKALTMGFQGFIMKPFTLRESAELVRRMLDQKRISDK